MLNDTEKSEAILQRVVQEKLKPDVSPGFLRSVATTYSFALHPVLGQNPYRNTFAIPANCIAKLDFEKAKMSTLSPPLSQQR